MDTEKFKEFHERYSSFSEEQLVITHQRKKSLTEEAAAALDHVINSRHIDIEDLKKNRRDGIEIDIKNAEFKNKNKKLWFLKGMVVLYIFIFVGIMFFSPNNEFRIDIAISSIITWFVILVPVFVIRFMRKGIPLKNIYAIVVCAILYVINFVFFGAIGFTSNSHLALKVGFIICFQLLTIESLKRQPESENLKSAA